MNWDPSRLPADRVRAVLEHRFGKRTKGEPSTEMTCPCAPSTSAVSLWVDDASLTQSGVVAGTPQYMSPEQARGEPVDHRSDLFSLGSVLYFMCVGHSPFRANSTPAVLRRVCDERPRPLAEVNPDVPAWL